MKMLRKIIDCEILATSDKNINGGVFSVKLNAYCVQTTTLL